MSNISTDSDLTKNLLLRYTWLISLWDISIFLHTDFLRGIPLSRSNKMQRHAIFFIIVNALHI